MADLADEAAASPLTAMAAQEVAADTAPVDDPQAAAAPEQAVVADAAGPEQATDAQNATEPQTTPEPEQAPQPDPEPADGPAPAGDPQPEAGPGQAEPEATPDPEPATEPQPAADPEDEAEPGQAEQPGQADPEAVPDPEPEAEPQADLDPADEPEPDPTAQPSETPAATQPDGADDGAAESAEEPSDQVSGDSAGTPTETDPDAAAAPETAGDAEGAAEEPVAEPEAPAASRPIDEPVQAIVVSPAIASMSLSKSADGAAAIAQARLTGLGKGSFTLVARLVDAATGAAVLDAVGAPVVARANVPGAADGISVRVALPLPASAASEQRFAVDLVLERDGAQVALLPHSRGQWVCVPAKDATAERARDGAGTDGATDGAPQADASKANAEAGDVATEKADDKDGSAPNRPAPPDSAEDPNDAVQPQVQDEGLLPESSFYGSPAAEAEGNLFAQLGYGARTMAPSSANGWFYSGVNPYYNDYLAPTGHSIGGAYTVGNCTWYAWGRAAEILGHAPNINGALAPLGIWDQVNATGAYRTGTEPRVGALVIGKANHWHVAVVERIENGVVYVSESGYATSSTWCGYDGIWFHYGPLNAWMRGVVGYIYLVDDPSDIAQQPDDRLADAPDDAWFVRPGWFKFVHDNGLMGQTLGADGSGTGLFEPDRALTLAEAEGIVYKAAHLISDANDDEELLARYPIDAAGKTEQEVLAMKAHAWCVLHGIATTEGTSQADGDADPDPLVNAGKPVTCGQFIDMMDGLVDYLDPQAVDPGVAQLLNIRTASQAAVAKPTARQIAQIDSIIATGKAQPCVLGDTTMFKATPFVPDMLAVEMAATVGGDNGADGASETVENATIGTVATAENPEDGPLDPTIIDLDRDITRAQAAMVAAIALDGRL